MELSLADCLHPLKGELYLFGLGQYIVHCIFFCSGDDVVNEVTTGETFRTLRHGNSLEA